MTRHIAGPPERSESDPYYYRYIDLVQDRDVIAVLAKQIDTAAELARKFSEERSLYRYGPDKWSIRELMGHVNDSERVFVFRALWFARGFDSALPSFDQDVGAKTAGSDEIPWKHHLDEFRAIRESTVAFFSHLQPDAWQRTGIASDRKFSVRALAFIIAGHFAHHVAVLNERYT